MNRKSKARSKAKSTEVVSNLKKIIKYTGMWDYELATVIGCPAATLSRWLTGRYPPSKAWQIIIESSPAIQDLLKQSSPPFP